MKLVAQVLDKKEFSWPELPYKGLNYYDLSDISIFAGREVDVEKCARLVQQPRTRLLFLHGSTGCGKSSFVRAGLIPLLEHRELGYSFVREDEEELTSHFIRSTDDPMSRLAELLFQLGRTKRTRKTPVGESTVDLGECIQPDQNNLQRFVRRSPEELLQVLSCFAGKVPETLVLIFDQVEEILTLRPGRNGDGSRDRFFRFLDLFMDAALDIKIVLALRTEYFGRVLDLLDYNISEGGNISYYLLKDLSEQELIRAIVRPTSDEEIGNHGSPRKKYGFKFAPGVPQAIARDLKRAVQAGGTLPVMQLVCGRLYRAVQRKPGDATVEITFDHYQGLGGVQGQIVGHLTDVLDRMCNEAGLAARDAGVESRCWRRVLLTLAKVQVDGTVTTEMRFVSDVETDIGKAACVIPAGTGIEFLRQPENRILRDVKVYNAEQRREIPCLALGHDAIGLALTNDSPSGEVIQRVLQNVRSVARNGAFFLFGVVLLFDAAFLFIRVLFNYAVVDTDAFWAINIVGIIYVAIIAFVASMPTMLYVNVLEVFAIVYGMIGIESLTKRLTALAEELRQSQPGDAAGWRTVEAPAPGKAKQRRQIKKSMKKLVPFRYRPNDPEWLKLALSVLKICSQFLEGAERWLRNVSGSLYR